MSTPNPEDVFKKMKRMANTPLDYLSKRFLEEKPCSAPKVPLSAYWNHGMFPERFEDVPLTEDERVIAEAYFGTDKQNPPQLTVLNSVGLHMKLRPLHNIVITRGSIFIRDPATLDRLFDDFGITRAEQLEEQRVRTYSWHEMVVAVAQQDDPFISPIFSKLSPYKYNKIFSE